MEKSSKVFVGMDVHKESIDVTLAEAGGEVRRLGQIGGDRGAVREMGREQQAKGAARGGGGGGPGAGGGVGSDPRARYPGRGDPGSGTRARRCGDRAAARAPAAEGAAAQGRHPPCMQDLLDGSAPALALGADRK